jgi:hypothetical protein
VIDILDPTSVWGPFAPDPGHPVDPVPAPPPVVVLPRPSVRGRLRGGRDLTLTIPQDGRYEISATGISSTADAEVLNLVVFDHQGVGIGQARGRGPGGVARLVIRLAPGVYTLDMTHEGHGMRRWDSGLPRVRRTNRVGVYNVAIVQHGSEVYNYRVSATLIWPTV